MYAALLSVPRWDKTQAHHANPPADLTDRYEIARTGHALVDAERVDRICIWDGNAAVTAHAIDAEHDAAAA